MTIRVNRFNQLLDAQRLEDVLRPVKVMSFTDDAPNVFGKVRPGTAWRWWSKGNAMGVGMLD